MGDRQVRRDARIHVAADATIIEVTDAALELLGMTLDQLKALPPGALSLKEDRAGSAEFKAAWHDSGRATIVGASTARLLDGELIRVRYVITPQPDGSFEVILERTDESVEEPPRTYTVGAVLSAWRAAERQLAALEPESEEWRVAQADIDYFRAEYQRVARERAAREDRPEAASTRL
jgi:hypothetical protein